MFGWKRRALAAEARLAEVKAMHCRLEMVYTHEGETVVMRAYDLSVRSIHANGEQFGMGRQEVWAENGTFTVQVPVPAALVRFEGVI